MPGEDEDIIKIDEDDQERGQGLAKIENEGAILALNWRIQSIVSYSFSFKFLSLKDFGRFLLWPKTASFIFS